MLPPRLPLSPCLVQPGRPRPGSPPCLWLPAGRSGSAPRSQDPRPGGASDLSPCAVPVRLSLCDTHVPTDLEDTGHHDSVLTA